MQGDDMSTEAIEKTYPTHPVHSNRRPVGRPSIYSAALADEVCDKIAQGMSVNQICALAGMPSTQTVYNWLFKEKDFIDKYAHARESQSEFYAQEMMDLADSCGLTPEQINKTKLQIDTRKWIASKLKPKKYGDSTILRGDKDNPIDLGLAVLLDAANVKREVLPVLDITPTTNAPGGKEIVCIEQGS